MRIYRDDRDEKMDALLNTNEVMSDYSFYHRMIIEENRLDFDDQFEYLQVN